MAPSKSSIGQSSSLLYPVLMSRSGYSDYSTTIQRFLYYEVIIFLKL